MSSPLIHSLVDTLAFIVSKHVVQTQIMLLLQEGLKERGGVE